MKRQSINFLRESELAWESPAEGLKRQILGYDDELMLVKIVFDKGAVGALHCHPHSQSSYVVSGVFEVEINAQRRTLSAGDGFYVEPNAQHGVVCLEAGTLIDTFAPMREDFL